MKYYETSKETWNRSNICEQNPNQDKDNEILILIFKIGLL